MWVRRPVAALGAVAVAGTLLGAGCGGGGHPSDAEAAMKEWVSQLATDYDAQWATLVAAQQEKIPKATFTLCNEEQYAGSAVGNTPPSATYLATVSVSDRSAVPPGATAAVPASVVTSKVKVGKVTHTITLTWFQLSGEWRWALSNSAAAAYSATTCPSVVSSTLPYKSVTATTTTSTTTTPTTTTPLVAPSNIRVQALNGLRQGPVSSEAITKLKSLGYVTGYPDNTTANVASSSIYVLTAGFVPEAQALAKSLGLPASDVVTTIPPPANAPIPNYALGHFDLVLVVGPDLAPKLNPGA